LSTTYQHVLRGGDKTTFETLPNGVVKVNYKTETQAYETEVTQKETTESGLEYQQVPAKRVDTNSRYSLNFKSELGGISLSYGLENDVVAGRDVDHNKYDTPRNSLKLNGKAFMPFEVAMELSKSKVMEILSKSQLNKLFVELKNLADSFPNTLNMNQQNDLCRRSNGIIDSYLQQSS
jgi:hypothetical protein